MANWQGFTLTEKGLKLQAKINAGLATLNFTKISIGSGSSNSSLTDLVKREKDLTIASCTVDGSIVKLVSTLTNTGITKPFKERELGLFATDPDDGEIMFAYMMDTDPDTMPAEGSTTVVSKRMTLNLTFSNTGNVSAVLDSGQLVTFADIKTATNDAEFNDNSDSKITSTSWVRGILNHWRSFKVSQVSDFAEGIIQKLALTSAITAISSLQTNSWFGQLLKMVLTASGVKYNIAQNGYVCLGSFFGGLIIQWGLIPDHTGHYIATLPVAVSEGILVLAGDTGEATICYGAQFKTTKSIAIYSSQQTWAQSTQYVAIGKI